MKPLALEQGRETVEEKLDRLGSLREKIANADAERQKAIDYILSAEVARELHAIEETHRQMTEAAIAEAAALEADIKEEVLARGQSIKGTTLHAIWMSGRVTWDGRGLEGFAVAHPEVERFRKVGNPSVSIRKIG